MNYCSSHMTDLGTAIRRRGLWRHVKPDNAARFMIRFLQGTATKNELDPLVIIMLELKAKAERMGLRPNAKRCPLCAIAFIGKDAEAPEKVIDGMMGTVVVPLLAQNGLRPSR